MLISQKHGTQEDVPENPNHFIGFFFSFGLGSAGSVAVMRLARYSRSSTSLM